MKKFKLTSFILILLFLIIGCNTENRLLTIPGVSKELAQFRRMNLSEITYSLFFSIPDHKDSLVIGSEFIEFSLNKKAPVILDFKQDSASIVSVSLNGEIVNYKFADDNSKRQ